MTTRWDVERAVTNSHIDSRGRLIVLALLTKVDNATAVTPAEHTPAFDTLAAMTGLSKAVLSEWLQALEDGGWVVRSKPEKGGKGHRTIYTLRPGADRIERRSRELRTPRKPSNSSLGEPFEEAQTVRPANPSETVNSSLGEPFETPKGFAGRTVWGSLGEPFGPSKGSPGEPATTTPPPTGEGILKNHHGARSAENPETSPAKDWDAANVQPRTEGTRVPRQPTLFADRQAEIEKLIEPLKVVGHWLQANGYPGVSANDCRAVHRAVIARYPGKVTIEYLRGIASGSGFMNFYQPILDARADEIQKKIRQLTDGQPDCGHGHPGGHLKHPTTGLELCPACRGGAPVPVQRLSETTHPDVRAALDAYRDSYRATYGATPLLSLLMGLTAEAETLRQHGVSPDTLTAIARTAGRTGSLLLETARSLKGQTV